MATDRRAEVTWKGSLMEGSGTITKTTSGAIGEQKVSWPARAEDSQGGTTSPEELIAAAHAACYAMALNATIGRKGGSAARTVVSATVIADKTDAGIKLTTSKLKVVAEGLKGIEKSQFAEVAREAEGKCPISNAIRGSMTIDVDAEAR